jgi:hypothetical protein
VESGGLPVLGFLRGNTDLATPAWRSYLSRQRPLGIPTPPRARGVAGPGCSGRWGFSFWRLPYVLASMGSKEPDSRGSGLIAGSGRPLRRPREVLGRPLCSTWPWPASPLERPRRKEFTSGRGGAIGEQQ